MKIDYEYKIKKRGKKGMKNAPLMVRKVKGEGIKVLAKGINPTPFLLSYTNQNFMQEH